MSKTKAPTYHAQANGNQLPVISVILKWLTK